MAKRKGKKAETPAPIGVIALQASLVNQAIASGAVEAGDMVAALHKIVASLEPAAKDALRTLAVLDPDAFLKHWISLLEFKAPRLARVEHKVEGTIDNRHFVAVEHREARPDAIDVTPAKAGD